MSWIKLHRSMVDWEWYDDHKVTRVFVHLLITANFETKNWRGMVINRGQRMTSYDTLSSEIGLTVQQIRTAFKKLKSTREINHVRVNNGLLITVNKYNEYQEKQHVNNTRITREQHEDNIKTTVTKEGKESKELKNREDAPAKKRNSKFCPPTIDEVKTHMISKGLTEILAARESSKFWLHYDAAKWMRGKTKIERWKSAATGWINRMDDFKTNTNGKSNKTNGGHIVSRDTLEQVYAEMEASDRERDLQAAGMQ